MTNQQRLCDRPTCPTPATTRVKAEDTSYGKQVCSSDVGWAKRQINEDLPGRAVVTESVTAPSIHGVLPVDQVFDADSYMIVDLDVDHVAEP